VKLVARLAAGRRSKWVVIAAWVLATLVAIPFQPKLQELASDESDAFQARNAESTRAADIIEQLFPGGGDTTALVLYTRDQPFLPQDAERVAADANAICNPLTIPDIVRVITPVQLACGQLPEITAPQSANILSASEDQTTQFTTVWTSDDATETVVRDVAAIRSLVPDPDDPDLRAYVTGEAAFAADQAAALEGIDETLLAVTLALVLVLLLLIYRSPIVALVPILVVGVAYIVAAAIVYAFATAGAFQATGQATAILIVLMFGAGTDYCLLLLARYREELRANTPDAMAVALERTGPAIVSAGGIVIVVMLALSVADYNATRWMGPVLAIGMAVTVLAGITLLPAVLAALPQRSFAKQRRPSRLWPRIGRLVRERPEALIVSIVALLVAGALGNLRDNGTLDFAEQFRTPPESVQGLRVMQEKFLPGQAGPIDVVVDNRILSESLPRLGGVLYGYSTDGRYALVRIMFDADPFSDDSANTIPERRAAVRAADPTALVGGPSAEIHDSKAALAADARLIVPLSLVLVFLIVAALLRSLIAPLYVIATVVLSYAFALGVSSLVFEDSDPAMPLFTFVFLVALGVDYNVFLITRIREARRDLAPVDAVITGLERTGGVITSAGLILAGTFCTLLATELESLFQVGFTVALGLLVDTFVIRIFLVPSIAVVLGSKAL
jgi:RND superfamily putative drug exporter